MFPCHLLLFTVCDGKSDLSYPWRNSSAWHVDHLPSFSSPQSTIYRLVSSICHRVIWIRLLTKEIHLKSHTGFSDIWGSPFHSRVGVYQTPLELPQLKGCFKTWFFKALQSSKQFLKNHADSSVVLSGAAEELRLTSSVARTYFDPHKLNSDWVSGQNVRWNGPNDPTTAMKYSSRTLSLLI